MLNVSQISSTLLSDLTHLITSESQHHVLASTEDRQRWPAEALYVSPICEMRVRDGVREEDGCRRKKALRRYLAIYIWTSRQTNG